MSGNAALSKRLIEQKCKLIIADVRRLDDVISGISYETLTTDESRMTRCERYLERIVNRAIDINFHLIRASGEPPPEDYTQSFLKLASLKILAPKFAYDIAPSVGARNILVHEYDDLDTKLFYSSLKDAIRSYPTYVKEVLKFIDTHS